MLGCKKGCVEFIKNSHHLADRILTISAPCDNLRSPTPYSETPHSIETVDYLVVSLHRVDRCLNMAEIPAIVSRLNCLLWSREACLVSVTASKYNCLTVSPHVLVHLCMYKYRI